MSKNVIQKVYNWLRKSYFQKDYDISNDSKISIKKLGIDIHNPLIKISAIIVVRASLSQPSTFENQVVVQKQNH